MRALLPVLAAGLCLLGIFLLPYHVPLHTPSSSQSWEFGFNNTVAQALIALLLLVLFAWQLAFGRIALADDLINRAVQPEGEPVSIRALLYTMGLLQLVTCAVVIAWYNILPMSHYGEMTYFIQRIEANLLGGVPYVDFAFDYGPLMLAVPVGIYHLFNGALSVEAAYGATLIIHYLIGIALLTYVVSQINARGRTLILAMVAFQWINLDMGLNYTPFRFTIVLASLFAIRHLNRVTRDYPYRMVLLALASFLLPLFNFAISPEMGLALTIGLLVYFLWFLLGSERRMALLAVPVIAGVLATALVFPRPYFDSMVSFGKGGANFPIFPTIHIVAFLAAAMWVFPRLGVIALRDKSDNGAFCAGFAFLSGLFIIPATGRCDPGHIWINSVGLFMIALAAISWMKPKWWYSLWAVYFIIFPATNQIANWMGGYGEQINNAINARSQLASVNYQSDNYAHPTPGSTPPPIHYSKLLPMSGLDKLPNAKIGLPLGDNEIMERFFKLTGRYAPEYHIEPYGDVFGPDDLNRKYQDMHSMEYIFVPSMYLGYLQPMNQQAEAEEQAAADRKYLSGLLFFPVNLPLVHPFYIPDLDIMRHIKSEYYLVQQFQIGVLLRRKDAR